MEPSNDLVSRFKLESKIFPNHTLHTYHRSEPAWGSSNNRVVTRLTKRWVRIKDVGAGNYSNVWLEVEEDKSERAVKRIPKWIYTRNKIDYKREIAAMAVLSKYEQNFVQFYGWYEGPDDVYLAMEYFPLGDLERYMDRQLSEIQIKVIIRQLLKGLCIMHQNGFTHRDLKPQNILVVKDNPDIWVKIGDFGITKRVPQDGTSLRTETGTSGYVAPEVLGYHDQESSKYTNAVDLWSFGCICHRLLTTQAPFENPAKMIRYCSGGTRLPIETLRKDDDEAVAFVKRLLMVDPSERYTAERALQSTWFNNPRSREPLYVAQCQSQNQERLPREIKALNGAILRQLGRLLKLLSYAHKPIHWLLKIVRLYENHGYRHTDWLIRSELCLTLVNDLIMLSSLSIIFLYRLLIVFIGLLPSVITRIANGQVQVTSRKLPVFMCEAFFVAAAVSFSMCALYLLIAGSDEALITGTWSSRGVNLVDM